MSNETAAQWMCKGSDPATATGTVRLSFHLVDFLSGVPPKNAKVSACRRNDIACAEPVQTWTDSDGTGHAQLELPYGFSGFFDIRTDYVATLYYITAPLWKNTAAHDLPLFSSSVLMLTASIAQTTLDKAKGFVLLQAFDCSDVPASGVQFTLGGRADAQFYLIDEAPNLEAKTTQYDAQTNTAQGGFLNVNPGIATFTALLGDDGLRLGSVNAQVRAATVTYIDMSFKADPGSK